MVFKWFGTWFGLIVLGVIAGLAWMPSPDVRDLRIFPMVWGDWLDTHDFERNVIGGAVLQIAVLALVAAWLPKRDFLKSTGVASLLSLGVFTLVECMQLLLPRRTFDWMDIGAAILGISISNGVILAIGLPIMGWITFRKSNSACTPPDSNRKPID